MTSSSGRVRILLGVLAVYFFFPSAALACETCAMFSATSLRERKEGSFTLSVAEQYTDYQLSSSAPATNSIQNGDVLKRYSTTQFDLGYDFSERFGLRLSLPLIVREFDLIKQYRRKEESESGVGDISLLAEYSPYSNKQLESAIHSTVYAGLKAPTGDTGSLEDQISASEEDPILDAAKHHQGGGIPGLQGQILSLGSGSWDSFFGLGALARWERYLLLATAEYTIRTEGDFDYRFADDVVWSTGPAWYLVLDDEHTIALQGLISGEYKGKDVHDGVKVKGTAEKHLFAGPAIIIAGAERWGGEISFQLPVYTDDPDALVVPEWRMKASLSYRF